MKVLVTFGLCFVAFGISFAEDEPEKTNKREKIVSFYKCMACAPPDAHAAYEKCKDLKTEKVFDCIAKNKEDVFKTFTEEDMASLKKFKDCAKGLKEQYCTEK